MSCQRAVDQLRRLPERVSRIERVAQRIGLKMAADIPILPDDLLERTPVLARFANRRIDEVASLRRIDPSTERRGEGLRHDQPLRQVQVPAHSIGVYLQRAQH